MLINGRALQAALAATAALLSASAANADTTPLGTWIDHTGRGAVEIKDCDGKLCGYVAWVKDPKDAEGCGEQIIGDVKPVGSKTWDNGWIYDPDRGEKFDVEIKPISDDKLRVTGYAGIKWLSETMTWKRAPADLEKCSKTTSAEATPADKPATAETAAKVEPKPADEAKSKTAEVKAETKDADKPAKMAATTPDDADETAEVNDNDVNDDEDTAADEPKKKRNAGKVIARIADELGVKVDKSGTSSISGKKTCQMRVPYVDMTVKFPCDG